MKTENEQPSIILNELGIEHLRTARKWSSFIAIIGLIIIGIMLFSMVGIALMASRFDQDDLLRHTALFQFVPIAILILVYGIPIYYLYQFGKHSKNALDTNDSDSMTTAFHYLKLHYRFMGILIIVAMVFYIFTIAAFTIPYLSSIKNW